jgi:hypothetical protein
MATIVKLAKCEKRVFDECYRKLEDLIIDFSTKYPEFTNLEKYG